MAVDTGEQVRSGGIGARLRAGREASGLTILQASERLHVDPRILESLEAEDFEALGAPVYARGHLRHYAELVGESAAELGSLYADSGSPQQQPDLTRIPKAPPPQDSNRLIVPTLIILAVFAIAGAVWWVLSLSARKPAASHSAAQNPPGVTTPLAMAGAEPPNTPTAASPSAPAPAAPAALPAVPAPAASDAAANPGSGKELHSARDAQLTLRYSADSWTEVYDAGGRRLFYAVGAGNTVKTLSGMAPLRVVLGNVSGVSIEVNGQGTSVAKWSQPDGSAQFLVSRSGRILRARPTRNGG